jgi:hypothetical protein
MPTYYWPTYQKKISDIIDFGVIKDIAKTYFSIKTSPELSSDHSPITININNKVIKRMQPCIRKGQIGIFREEMRNTLNTQLSLIDHSDVEYFLSG